MAKKLQLTDEKMVIYGLVMIFVLGIVLVFMFNVLSPSKEALTQRAYDYTGFLAGMKNAGYNLEIKETISAPFLPFKAYIVKLGIYDMKVFEFDDAGGADSFAANVSSDGMIVSGAPVEWPAPPHFYKSGYLVVVYAGSNPEIMADLELLLDRQFAGQ